MQPEVKLSKFMFHLKFSRKEDYVHEHELYEVMRSRNLYQYQFSVRSNFQKEMRNIEISEKAQRYGFENSRKLFVQRMRERREQTDKLREKYDNLMKKLRTNGDGKKLKRRYVPIPASTIVYEELPAIAPKVKSQTSSMTHRSEGEKSRDLSPVQAPPTPSAITATVISGHTNIEHNTRNETTSPSTNKHLAPQIQPAGIEDAGLVEPESRQNSSIIETHPGKTFHLDENGTATLKKEVEEDDLESSEDYERKQREFESKAIRGHGKQHTSTVQFSNDPPTDRPKSKAIPATFSDTMSKIEVWREKHALVSKTDFEKEAALGRLMIDRPSKWALSHLHDDAIQSTELGMRYQTLKMSLRKFDSSFKKKSQQLDDLSTKLLIKSKQKLSLPELDTTPKPMASLDPGGTTPDGRLILTKADYEDYLSDYRKARTVRLDRSKKKAKLLNKLVENFTLDPHHRLHDDTDLASGIHTI